MPPTLLIIFFRNPGNSLDWTKRSDAFASGSVNGSFSFTSQHSGFSFLPLVVCRDGGIGSSTTITVSLSSVGGGGGSGGGPEFEAKSVSASGTYAPGDQISITREIENVGSASGDCDYELRLSTNDIISTQDTLVYSATTATISSGATSSLTVTGTIPSGAADGSYYIGLLITDSDAGSPDYVASSTATVTIQSPGGGGGGGGGGSSSPLFQAISVSAISGTYSPGDTIQVDRSIKNAGNAAGACNYRVYLSTNSTIATNDVEIYVGTTASISVGATNSITIQEVLPSSMNTGTYYVGVLLDDSDADPSRDTVASAARNVTVTSSSGGGSGGGGSGGRPLFRAVSVTALDNALPGNSIRIERVIGNSGAVAGDCSYRVFCQQIMSLQRWTTKCIQAPSMAWIQGWHPTAS